jgi:hypothetical protein
MRRKIKQQQGIGLVVNGKGRYIMSLKDLDIFLEALDRNRLNPEQKKMLDKNLKGYKKTDSKLLGKRSDFLHNGAFDHLASPMKKKKIREQRAKSKQTEGKIIYDSFIDPDFIDSVNFEVFDEDDCNVFIYFIDEDKLTMTVGGLHSQLEKKLGIKWNPENKNRIYGRYKKFSSDDVKIMKKRLYAEDLKNAPEILKSGLHLTLWQYINKITLRKMLKKLKVNPEYIYMPKKG